VQGRGAHRLSDINVSTARLILVALICASPAALLWGGVIAQGLTSGVVALALAITARGLRPGETGFLVSIIRLPVIFAAIPALWMLIQALPLGVFPHPIWRSAEAALGHPLASAISVDPGASVIAVGQYLSTVAVMVLSAAVAVDRQRAEWILFALTAAATACALIVLTHDLLFAKTPLAAFTRARAIDCACLGTLIAAAACIHTFERFAARQANPERSVLILLQSFLASSVALAICGGALVIGGPLKVLFPAGYGLFALAGLMTIRRLGLELWGVIGIAAPALVVGIFLVAAHPPERGINLVLAFASASSPSLTALSERVLDDAPLVGTGAGTFAALAPIYREMDDPEPGSAAATAAANVAIELGKPMFWLVAGTAAAMSFILLRASLRRGRDSFYSAMGAGCIISLLLLSFTNAGLLGTTTGLIAAAALGLAFAQSKGRTAQP